MRSDDIRSRAEQGNAPAQSVLGISYLLGEGMPRDAAQALRWLTAAAAQGASRAQAWLGTMYEQGLSVSVDLDHARQLYEAAATRGEFFGCIFLARLLASGKCGTDGRVDAAHWYRQALSLDVEPCPELDEARHFLA